MKKKFKLLIEGQNYIVHLDNTPQRCGFFTTRFIDADNSSDAENIVLQLIKDELKGVVLNDRNDPPVIYFDEIIEIASFGNNDVPGFGFTWFKEESPSR